MLTVVCGMPWEMQILEAIFPADVVKLTGSAKIGLSSLVPRNCNRILSFGLSGGLSQKIAVADIAIASSLTDGPNVWTPDQKWRRAIQDSATMLTMPRTGDMGSQYDTEPVSWNFLTCPWYSSDQMDLADTATQRADLLTKTGAWSIDDESIYVAKLAADRNIPFAIVRSCSDDASETLPLAARGTIMNSAGGANLSYLFQTLKTEPWAQTLALGKVELDFNASLTSLAAAGTALMPALLG